MFIVEGFLVTAFAWAFVIGAYLEPLMYMQIMRWIHSHSSVQFAQSSPALFDPMDCSTPGFPVRHQLLELAQTHVHRVGDAIQPSHPLSLPSPALNLSQHQGLFQ